MKKLFMTGLAILLPMVVTLIIVVFILNLLTKPFTGFVQELLDYYDLLDKPFWIFNSSEILIISSKIIVLFFIISLTILIGFIARLVLIRYFFRVGDWLIHQIPLVNKIYKAIQDTLQTVFSTEKKANFSQVVLVPFPHPKSYSIGLTTSQSKEESDLEHRDLISVFVPGTPNPTMGFMLLFRKDQLIPIDMRVEDAFKFLVSCGVMLTDFKIDTKQPL